MAQQAATERQPSRKKQPKNSKKKQPSEKRKLIEAIKSEAPFVEFVASIRSPMSRIYYPQALARYMLRTGFKSTYDMVRRDAKYCCPSHRVRACLARKNRDPSPGDKEEGGIAFVVAALSGTRAELQESLKSAFMDALHYFNYLRSAIV